MPDDRRELQPSTTQRQKDIKIKSIAASIAPPSRKEEAEEIVRNMVDRKAALGLSAKPGRGFVAGGDLLPTGRKGTTDTPVATALHEGGHQIFSRVQARLQAAGVPP